MDDWSELTPLSIQDFQPTVELSSNFALPGQLKRKESRHQTASWFAYNHFPLGFQTS